MPGQAGQEGGYKTPPVMITSSDESQIRTTHTGAPRQQSVIHMAAQTSTAGISQF